MVKDGEGDVERERRRWESSTGYAKQQKQLDPTLNGRSHQVERPTPNERCGIQGRSVKRPEVGRPL